MGYGGGDKYPVYNGRHAHCMNTARWGGDDGDDCDVIMPHES